MANDDRPFEIRPSPIQGLGAFATRYIPAGVRLIEYAGERLTPAAADARYPDVAGERHHTFLFAIDDDIVIDAAVNGNDARFINHSCDPNCDAVVDDGRIWIETIRDVAPGEELAYDYAYILDERHTPAAKRRFPCHCGVSGDHTGQEAVTGNRRAGRVWRAESGWIELGTRILSKPANEARIRSDWRIGLHAQGKADKTFVVVAVNSQIRKLRQLRKLRRLRSSVEGCVARESIAPHRPQQVEHR